MLCRRVLPALILALSVLLTACPSENTRPDEYYCAPGYHLVTGGACVLDEAQADGDRPDSAEPDAEWHDQERWESPETREAEAELTEAEAEREAESEDVAETDTATPDGDERDADPVADDESDADSTDAADGDEDARDADESVAPESDGAEPEAEEAPPTYCLTLKAPTVLAVGGVSRLESTLAFCDGSKKIDDYTLTPTPYDHTLLDVSATTDASPSYTLKGIAVGEPTLQAEARIGTKVVATESVKLRIVARQRVEARGLWVNRWAFAGDKTQGQKDIAQIMDNAKNAHFNQIYFQVRGTFDAYYDSNYEPWAARLSGTLGKDPGWDPLAVAISEAHNRGLELHAWINVFTIWASTTAPSDNEHALVKYPGWVMCDASGQAMTTLVDSYIWASPGNSWVRAHNTAVVADIATRYDVDGIHLDRVRYPGTAYSHDAASESAYATAKETRPALSFADWEREQVVAQVAEMYAALTDKAPRVALSAAVIGIYKDVWGWGSVSQGYYDSLQDSRAFDEQGVIDALMPMVYWPCTDTGSRTDFCAIAADWGATRSRALMIMGADLDAAKSALAEDVPLRRKAGYESFAQLSSQVAKTRQLPGVDGWALYDYSSLKSADYWAQFASGPFADEAVVPFMWWK